MKAGIGYDIHRLVPGRKLVLGGVEIPHSTGLLGHSDADVLLHSIADALLGAMAKGDIGRHFPDTDPRYKGISSMVLLEKVAGMLEGDGLKTVNVDAVVIAEQPRIAPHVEAMRENISGVLGVDISGVNIKATTNEGMGDIGRGEAIAVYSVAVVE